MPKLASKTAIVTGGASGIGLAICKLFAQEGAAVEILDRNVDEMNKAEWPTPSAATSPTPRTSTP
jgi:2-keto-3-deoxy-L-fuconate dehydrogenase